MENLHPDTLQICEMFPDIPLNRISETLCFHKGDIGRSCEELLNHSVIELEECNEEAPDDLLLLEDEEPSFVEVHSRRRSNDNDNRHNRKLRSNRKPRGQQDKESKEIQDLAILLDNTDQVVSLLQLDRKDEEKVKQILMHNNQNMVKTVLYFLRNYKKHTDNGVQGTMKINNNKGDKIVMASRVQGGYNSNNLNSHRPSSMDEVMDKEMNPISKPDQSSNTTKLSYLNVLERSLSSVSLNYSKEQMAIRKELHIMKKKNKTLFVFPDSFYDMALYYFDYDVAAILALIFKLLENKTEVQTEFKIDVEYVLSNVSPEPDDIMTINGGGSNSDTNFQVVGKRSNDNRVSHKSREELLTEVKRLRQEAVHAKSRELKASYAERARELSEMALDKLDEIQDNIIDSNFNKYRVDLHSLTVAKAIQAVDSLLKEWWEDELTQRDVHGASLSSTNILYTQPFTIITGRGIHSSNGFSKIRSSVSRYLTDNRYIFDEAMGSFTVHGKKR